MVFFPFTNLSTELALEIIRIAASPEFEASDNPHRSCYTTAISLASVSYAVRSATMPHILHTVVLSSPPHVLAFVQAILLQRTHRRKSSRLTLDYTKLVRRFWSTECWEPVVDDVPDDPVNYSALYEVIRGVESLGLNFRSLHLLYNGLGSADAKPSVDWTCGRVTFAGSFWRWRPLSSTPEGQSFLAQLTHLVLWIPNHELGPLPDQNPVPGWVEHVPFSLMPNLTHFAFPLLRKREHGSLSAPTDMMVYVTPNTSENINPTMFKNWAFSGDPSFHGIVMPFHVLPIFSTNRNEDFNWELAYMNGESDSIWARAEEARKLRGLKSGDSD